MAGSSRTSFTAASHVVTIERLDRNRWRVLLDGRHFAIFCSESRARTAGRAEARRLDFVADDLTSRR